MENKQHEEWNSLLSMVDQNAQVSEISNYLSRS